MWPWKASLGSEATQSERNVLVSCSRIHTYYYYYINMTPGVVSWQADGHVWSKIGGKT